MDIIRELEQEQLKSEVTPFNVGDTIRVYAKVVEGSLWCERSGSL